MILFKIQFPYKGKIIEAQVHELETFPKQWHVIIDTVDWQKEINGTYIIQYDASRKQYIWGFPDFDSDHSFMHSLGLSLRKYLWVSGFNSVNI